MGNKPLTADYISNLLAPKAAKKISEPVAQFVTIQKPDPLKLQAVGYPQEGDRGDIWAQWVKQDRRGSAELIERWG